MANESQAERVLVEDVLGVLKIYSDGSVERTDNDPALNTAASEKPLDKDGGVASKDIMLDPDIGLWVRIYLPPQRRTHMPVILYFHGGGFCCLSPSFTWYHSLCLKWAASVGAIIVSVNYRMAPEHRLPAAYDDCLAAVEWLRDQSMNITRDGEAVEPWLNSHADISNVHLMGDSAGGNIVHHLVMRSALENWNPLQIKGAILVQPFFGSEERTQSETKCPENAVLTLKFCDIFWNLALPLGANRDHHFSNPCGEELPIFVLEVLPPMIVVIGGRDPLGDKEKEYCQALKKCGKTNS